MYGNMFRRLRKLAFKKDKPQHLMYGNGKNGTEQR